MKKFVVKTLMLLIIPVFFYCGIGILLKLKIRNDIENHQIFVFGDSQTEFIKFPEIYNHSIHGSPYYVQYEFAKEFISALQGKKVYISCNYHNLSNLYQNRLANDALAPGWRASTFKDLDEYNLINYVYPDIRPADLEYSFFDIKKMPRLLGKLYMPEEHKNIEASVVNDTLSIKGTIERHWKHPEYTLKDAIQKKYLDKLIQLLADNNCEIVLLKMPLTNFYVDHVPSKIKKELTQLPNTYNIRLLDLNTALNISKDYTYFKDYGHLNSKGDALVTEYFKNYELKEKMYTNM